MGNRMLRTMAVLAGLPLVAGGLGLVGGLGASVLSGPARAGAATSGSTPGFDLRCGTVPIITTLVLPTTTVSASLTPSPVTADGIATLGDLHIRVAVEKTLALLVKGKVLGVTVRAAGSIAGGTPSSVALDFKGTITVPTTSATIPSTGVVVTLPGTATPATVTAGTASSLTVGLEVSTITKVTKTGKSTATPSRSATTVAITLAGTAVGPFACSNPAETIVGDTVSAPATKITSVLPNSGPLAGGEDVTIAGHFLKGQSATAPAVFFGTAEVPASNVDAVSTTQLIVVTPSHPAGTVRVRVKSKLGTSSTTSADDYTYTNAPVVTGITPSGGPVSGGTTVTISGLQLGTATGVDFGTVPAESFQQVSASLLVAVAPPGRPGTVNVTITSAEGTSLTDALTEYTYQANGYWLGAGDGGIFTFGAAAFDGSMGGIHLNAPVVGMAASPTGGGYWEVAADGGVFAFGRAGFHGSMGGIPLDAPVVGMAADPATGGYWLVARDGGVFAFTAPFDGSLGSTSPNGPVVGMAAMPTGAGYWLASATGSVYAFGTAIYDGSMGDILLDAPVVGMAATPTGDGYWLVAATGGVFTFGTAAFYGSMTGVRLDAPVVGMAADPSGGGYWLVAATGGVFTFGAATFDGSMGGVRLDAPVVGMATP